MTKQAGFTLIEAMIVVAIIGVLAAIAIPAYQDYTVKTRVLEGVSLSSPARTALALACQEADLANMTGNSGLGLITAASYGQNSDVVTSISAQGTSATGGTVTITFAAIGSSIDAGSTVIYTGTCGSGGMSWTAAAGGDFPTKFVPKT